MKCFYHSADLDGHCSGAIVKRANPECEMIGYNYGQEFPWDTIRPDEEVYMVDVSLPMDEMFALNEQCKNLIWIDHHISAINDHAEKAAKAGVELFGLRDTSEAACELVWRWFWPEKQMPHAVRFLGIYDSWRFSKMDEDVIKAFQYGMRMEKETRPEHAMDFWNELFCDGIGSKCEEIGTRGSLLWEYQLVQNEKTCRACAFETVLEYPINLDAAESTRKPALKCIAVNSNLMNSDVFRSAYDPEQHDAMLCFYRSKRGFWRCSIYSDRPDVDCSVYAKSYGGGGHKGAAGFQCNELPFALNAAAGK